MSDYDHIDAMLDARLEAAELALLHDRSDEIDQTQLRADLAAVDSARSETHKLRAMLIQIEDRLGAADDKLALDLARANEYAQHLGAWLEQIGRTLDGMKRSRP